MALFAPTIQSVHLIGIAGSGMKSLARLLIQWGWRVSGSDCSLSHETAAMFRSLGITVHVKHDPEFVPSDVNLVVYSAAVQKNNPEWQHARAMNVELLSYAQMLGQLSRNFQTTAIAGTHGKTTTAAMTSAILTDAGLASASIFGGELLKSNKTPQLNLKSNAKRTTLAVIEACEYQKHFLNLAPHSAAILGVEPDHFDSYSSFEKTKESFAQFAALLPEDGYLLIRGDDADARDAAKPANTTCETFGLSSDCDWSAIEKESSPHGTACEFFYRNQPFAQMVLPMQGEHNMLNALAASALAHRQHVSAESIQNSLAQFPGVQRRLELHGEWRGVTVIDDFAHHPTAIKYTLKTIRKMYPAQRVVCLFQPHQVSRTKALLSEFANALQFANSVLIAPIFAAREEPGMATISVAKQLADQVALKLPATQFVPALDRIVSTLEDECRPGDVLVTIGAGDIDWVTNELTGKIQRNYAS